MYNYVLEFLFFKLGTLLRFNCLKKMTGEDLRDAFVTAPLARRYHEVFQFVLGGRNSHKGKEMFPDCGSK